MIFVLLPFYFPCRVFVVTDLQSKQGWKVPLETTRVQDSPQSKAARSESLGFCLGKFKAFPKVKIPQHFQLQYLITLMLKIFLLIFYWNFPYSSVCLLPLIPPQCSSGKLFCPHPLIWQLQAAMRGTWVFSPPSWSAAFLSAFSCAHKLQPLPVLVIFCSSMLSLTLESPRQDSAFQMCLTSAKQRAIFMFLHLVFGTQI